MSKHARRPASEKAAPIPPFNELRKGNSAALKRYINEGGNVNAREADPPHLMLLQVACAMKLSTAARLLVEAGADVNATADDGSTPLMIVQTADLARLLLDSGADVELTDVRGWNALRVACEKDNIELAKLFLKRGSAASITQPASDGFTPLSTAVVRMQEALALLVLAAHPAEYDGNEVLQAPNIDTNLVHSCWLRLCEAS
jgi:ankyrin repeat protein